MLPLIPRLSCGGGGISAPRGFGTPGAGRSLRSVAGAAATPGLARDVGAQVAAGPAGTAVTRGAWSILIQILAPFVVMPFVTSSEPCS